MKKFKKFKEYDDYGEMSEARKERASKLNEKRMKSALRQMSVDQLMEIEDDYY